MTYNERSFISRTTPMNLHKHCQYTLNFYYFVFNKNENRKIYSPNNFYFENK